MSINQAAALASALRENVSEVIIGKKHEIELGLTTLLSGGHVLLGKVEAPTETVK